MIACHVVPVLRAIRRVAVARPRIAAPAAVAGSVVRRAPRVMLVCRDVGALGGAAALAGSAASVAPAGAPAAPSPPVLATGGPAALPGGEGGGLPFPGPPLASPPGVPPGVPTGVPTGPGHPPFLPPGLLFPPGGPPSGDGPRDDWTTVVVRVPEVPPPLGVPEPSALALFAVASMVAVILGRRARRA